MKNILKKIALFALTVSCKAQTQILDISDSGWNMITGAYYKDTNNLLDPFVGTYVYTNGNTSLKIVLQKKLMSSPTNHRYYEDLIIGGYQYIKDGEQITNSLNRLDAPNIINGRGFYSIKGNMIIKQGDPPCQHCIAGEKALYIGLIDDLTDNWASVTIRRIIESGQPAIEIDLFWEGPKAWKEGTPRPLDAIFPGGYYTLIKQ